MSITNSSVDLDTLKPDQKVWCTVCKFVVIAEGHESRCRSPTNQVETSRLRRLAWLGDAKHIRDVRAVLLAADIDDNRLQTLAGEYVCRESQAAWYKNYYGSKIAPIGTSKHSVATAFEASYYGEFRDAYLLWLTKQFHINSFDPELEKYL